MGDLEFSDNSRSISPTLLTGHAIPPSEINRHTTLRRSSAANAFSTTTTTTTTALPTTATAASELLQF